MKIIYAYKRNTYAAYRAAYLRLNLDITLLSKSQLELEESQKGSKPYYLGIDEEINEIYVANYGKSGSIFKNAMEGLGKLYEEEVEVILLN